MFDEVFLRNAFFIMEGAGVTLKYSVLSVALGMCIGALLALAKVGKYRALRYAADIYTSIFRGTPLLIQLSIIYFGLPTLTGHKFSVFSAGVIAFSLNSGAYVSEIIRAGLNSVDKGQIEAAKALGIPPFFIMKDIVFPQAVKNIFPSLVNELINMLKESALISIIGEMDLMRRAQLVSGQSYDYFTPMFIAAACYYLMILVISSLAKIAERRIAQ